MGPSLGGFILGGLFFGRVHLWVGFRAGSSSIKRAQILVGPSFSGLIFRRVHFGWALL